MSRQVFIVDRARIAIGNFGGSMAPVRTDDLGTIAIKGLLEKKHR